MPAMVNGALNATIRITRFETIVLSDVLRFRTFAFGSNKRLGAAIGGAPSYQMKNVLSRLHVLAQRQFGDDFLTRQPDAG